MPPTPSPFDPDLRALSHRAISHARRLCVDIGPRPAGSLANRAAADYIERVLDSAGFFPQRQWFSCPGWEHTETQLSLGNHLLEAQANWRSLGCNITETIVPVGSLDELERAQLTGHIALLYGELTQDEIQNRSTIVYYPERHRKTNELLDKKRPAAVITVSPRLDSIRHVIKDFDCPIPSVTVSPRVGMELLASAGKQATLQIDAQRVEGLSCNVIGKKESARAERIVLCAHYDSVWGAPGALDNASGIAVLLTVAEALRTQKLPLGLELVAFSAEEYGGQGTDAYLAPYGLKQVPFRMDRPFDKSEAFAPIVCVINVDAVGGALCANTVTSMGGSNAFSELVSAVRTAVAPDIAQVPPWPSSDHYTYYSHGVPAIALGSVGGTSDFQHSPQDSFEWLNAAQLGKVVKLVLGLLDALQDKSPGWSRG